MSLSDAHETFLRVERGINRSTAETFGLHSDGDTLVLPHKTGEKRRFWKNGERGFTFTEGRKPYLYGTGYEGKDTVFLVEGETDTMRLFQELQEEGSDAGVAGIPGIHTWKEPWSRALDGAKKIYVVLDNDEDYKIRAEVEKLWDRLESDLGSRAVRVRLPDDVKDLCEFFKNYNLDALREKVGEATNGRFHYEALDLSLPPPPYEWLIKGFLCKNDTTLWMGPPTVGKSLTALDLCIKFASNAPEWLGMPLLRGGKVLYVDEENPRDVVYNRLHALGASTEAMQNIRYLHEQGIRLDKHPTKLLDEVKAWQPDLIVLDSLKRFHRLDENSASDMSTVFEDGIKPITRVSGANVIVLHHSVKSDNNDSHAKSRGSGDITAAPDSGIEVKRTDTHGGACLKHFKGRRSETQEPVNFKIEGDETSITITRVKANF